MKGQMEAAREMVERRLAACFPGEGLAEAMRYTLLSGGKRLRPILTMAFCAAAGEEMATALDFGCGVEMLHTYSLIHDDLPCMDDDDLRRGRPANHKVYGECVATLAGDALQAAAFQTVLEAPGPWRKTARPAPMEAALLLARSAGAEGMCLGQYWDTVAPPGRNDSALKAIHSKKTGALIQAACRMGVLAAKGRRPVDPGCDGGALGYGAHLALAFQIRDDMLDVMGQEADLGKPIGSDAALGKATYASLLGLDACAELVAEHTRRAIAYLEQGRWPGGTQFLAELARSLSRRTR